jgi:hypothetical protein
MQLRAARLTAMSRARGRPTRHVGGPSWPRQGRTDAAACGSGPATGGRGRQRPGGTARKACLRSADALVREVAGGGVVDVARHRRHVSETCRVRRLRAGQGLAGCGGRCSVGRSSSSDAVLAGWPAVPFPSFPEAAAQHGWPPGRARGHALEHGRSRLAGQRYWTWADQFSWAGSSGSRSGCT